jgi:hypothetical protein
MCVQINEAWSNDGVARIVPEREGCRKGEGRGIKPAIGGFGSGIWVAGQVGPLDIVAVHEPDVCHVVESSQVHGKGSTALGDKNSGRAPAAGYRTGYNRHRIESVHSERWSDTNVLVPRATGCQAPCIPLPVVPTVDSAAGSEECICHLRYKLPYSSGRPGQRHI